MLSSSVPKRSEGHNRAGQTLYTAGNACGHQYSFAYCPQRHFKPLHTPAFCQIFECCMQLRHPLFPMPSILWGAGLQG